MNYENKVTANSELKEKLASTMFDIKRFGFKIFLKVFSYVAAIILLGVIVTFILIKENSPFVNADEILANANNNLLEMIKNLDKKFFKITINGTNFFDDGSKANNDLVEIWTDGENFRTKYMVKTPEGNSVQENTLLKRDANSREYVLYKAYIDSMMGEEPIVIDERHIPFQIPDKRQIPDYLDDGSITRGLNPFAGIPVSEDFYNLDALRALRGCDDCYASVMESKIFDNDKIKGQEVYKIKTFYPDEYKKQEGAPDEAFFTLITWISKDTDLILKRQILSDITGKERLIYEQGFETDLIDSLNDDFFTLENWKAQKELENLMVQQIPPQEAL